MPSWIISIETELFVLSCTMGANPFVKLVQKHCSSSGKPHLNVLNIIIGKVLTTTTCFCSKTVHDVSWNVRAVFLDSSFHRIMAVHWVPRCKQKKKNRKATSLNKMFCHHPSIIFASFYLCKSLVSITSSQCAGGRVHPGQPQSTTQLFKPRIILSWELF